MREISAAWAVYCSTVI